MCVICVIRVKKTANLFSLIIIVIIFVRNFITHSKSQKKFLAFAPTVASLKKFFLRLPRPWQVSKKFFGVCPNRGKSQKIFFVFAPTVASLKKFFWRLPRPWQVSKKFFGVCPDRGKS